MRYLIVGMFIGFLIGIFIGVVAMSDKINALDEDCDGHCENCFSDPDNCKDDII